MRVQLSTLLVFVSAAIVHAQEITVRQLPAEANQAGTMEAVQLTDWTIDQARLQGTFQVEKSAKTPTEPHIPADVGDRKVFKVLSPSTLEVDDIEFELAVIDESVPPRFQVWTEVALMENGELPQDSVDTFVEYLGERTPPRSWNNQEGIVNSVETLLGNPPDVDDDGITDFLILDIRDDFDGTTELRFIAAFLNLRDLLVDGGGNYADIVYVDTNPGLSLWGARRVAGVVAREYSRLVMINYGAEELPFIHWGMAWWARVALGFGASPAAYLSDESQYNRELYAYDGGFGGGVDDARGELFFNYIADQFGVQNMSKIVQSGAPGSVGLESALAQMNAGIGLERLVEDFHAANAVNINIRRHAQYGYITEERSDVRARAYPVINGSGATETPPRSIAVAAGGVAYIEWNQVKDISLSVTLGDRVDVGDLDLRVVVFAFTEGQNLKEIVWAEVSAEDIRLEGDFERVLLVLAHTNPDGEQGTVSYSAQWETGQPSAVVDILYDSGKTEDGLVFGISTDPQQVQSATAFDTPVRDGQVPVLDRVWLSHGYFSQAGLVPISTPRDFELFVWEQGTDGRPGRALLRERMEDTRPFRDLLRNLVFMEIDMTPYADRIGELPDVVYIGTGEAGLDDNYHIFLPSYGGGDIDSRSFLYVPSRGRWLSLWEIQLEGAEEDPLEGYVLGTRARFIFPRSTGVDATASEFLHGVRLDPNYPNPFKGATRITYQLEQHGSVHLSVMDLLGRRIDVLVDAEQAAGEYDVIFDGAGLSSGVYFYRLEHAGRVKSHRMVLVQ